MIYFTSDWHLGDNRIGVEGKPNLLLRPFSSVKEMNGVIFSNFCTTFEDGDTLYHLGDVLYSTEYELGEKYLASLKHQYPNSKFILIEGNHDEDKLDILSKYFDEIHKNIYCAIDGISIRTYLDHYPINCANQLKRLVKYEELLTITGHIHGHWRIQKSMINVGIDAWHFKPISVDEINFLHNAMINHFANDPNVFIGSVS